MILHFSWELWQRLREYVTASLPNEVTGIGAIKIINSREIKVTDIFLPQQKVNASYSQFTKGELGMIISNFVRNNPARAGLFLILLEIIQHVLATCVSGGIHMLTVTFSGRQLTKVISTVGKVIMFLT